LSLLTSVRIIEREQPYSQHDKKGDNNQQSPIWHEVKKEWNLEW